MSEGRGARGDEVAFRALNLPQAGTAPDLFGLWEPVFESDFSLTEEEADELRWAIDLPLDPRRAAAGMDTGHDRLDTLLLDLDAAERRLDEFVATGRQPPPEEASYAVGDDGTAAPVGEPEADLHGLLEEIALVGKSVAQDSDEPAAFDTGEPVAGRVQAAQDGFEAFLRQFYRAVSHYAWVETSVQGRLVGRTRVSWLGDADTTWRTPVTAEQIALHQRAVTLALNTRAAAMRVAVLVIQGARLLAQLPVMVASPIGIVMAIPAAWRFLDQVLAEARRLRGLPESSP